VGAAMKTKQGIFIASVAQLKKAIRYAAEDAYKSEVIDPEMEECIIGTNGDYATKEDWIEDRIADWMQRR
jgi:hypothetical protein